MFNDSITDTATQKLHTTKTTKAAVHLHSRSFFLSDFGDLELYLMAYLSGTVDSVEDSLVVDSLARRDGRFAALLDGVEELSDLPVEHALLGLFEHRNDCLDLCFADVSVYFQRSVNAAPVTG